MKILSPEQLKALDAATMQKQNLSSLELMEILALALMEVLTKRWSNTHSFLVFAGPGNNGGDGLAIARLLSELDYKVTVFLINPDKKLSRDCQTNFQRLQQKETVSITEVVEQFITPKFSQNCVIIDALFGIGLNKPLIGGFAALVKFINASNVPVVSVDMPSGLMCEDNTHNYSSHIIKANLTLTLHAPKLSQLLPENQVYVGELMVVDIGLDLDFVNQLPCDYEFVEASQLSLLLKKRPLFAHKGHFGHALLVAGKYGMAGAAVLSSKACFNVGVGKITIHTARKNNDILQIAVPEAIVSLDDNEYEVSTALKSDIFDAIGIGPGLGTSSATALAFIEQIRHSKKPIVIDADGINILSGHKGWLQQVPQNTIFTPHLGEYKKFGNRVTDSYSALIDARKLAQHHHFYIILKGHYTMICTPEGKVYFNNTGNSGMATAGTGDVLTGMILGFLAQGYNLQEVSQLAVYLHGLAGDIAADKWGEESLTASRLIEEIPVAFKLLKNIK